jgi:hypothetical protein
VPPLDVPPLDMPPLPELEPPLDVPPLDVPPLALAPPFGVESPPPAESSSPPHPTVQVTKMATATSDRTSSKLSTILRH